MLTLSASRGGRPITLKCFSDALSFALTSDAFGAFRVLVAYLDRRGRLRRVAPVPAGDDGPPVPDAIRDLLALPSEGAFAAVVYSKEPAELSPTEERVADFVRLRALAATKRLHLIDWIILDDHVRSMAFTHGVPDRWWYPEE